MKVHVLDNPEELVPPTTVAISRKTHLSQWHKTQINKSNRKIQKFFRDPAYRRILHVFSSAFVFLRQMFSFSVPRRGSLSTLPTSEPLLRSICKDCRPVSLGPCPGRLQPPTVPSDDSPFPRRPRTGTKMKREVS